MEQSEAITDFAPKKLARQLDFTAFCRASANVILPEHSKLQQLPPPSSHSQPHLKLQPPPPPQPVQSQLLSQPQPQPLLHLQLQTPPKQPPAMPQLQARPQQAPVVRRIPHPVQKLPLPTMPIAKQESPGSRPRNNVEAKDGTPKKVKQCNCKNSRCLKLYCECFAAGIHCNGCNCINCYNNVENEAARQEAVGATLERNPNAFRPKIASSPHGHLDAREDAREAQIIGKHNKGCHCKKSGCLKKYCECFQANILCSDNCKCMDCKNFEGSEERRALFHVNHNGIACMQQAANAAIGSSGYGTPLVSKKRKNEELLGSVTKDQSEKFQQENHLRNSAASSSPLSAPVSHAASATVLGLSKLTYKSPLAGVLQPQDVKDICSLLVVLSEEARKALAGKMDDRQPERENNHNVKTTSALSTQGRKDSLSGCDVHKTLPDDCVNGNKAISDLENGRPASPEIDLMCHEQEMIFMEAGPPTGVGGLCGNKTQISSSGHECSEVYAEQEKIILTRFRDFLNRLITCGSIKETMYSPLAKSKMGNQQELAERENINAATETGNHKKAYNNAIVKSPVSATSASNGILPIMSAPPVENGEINLENKNELNYEENSSK